MIDLLVLGFLLLALGSWAGSRPRTTYQRPPRRREPPREPYVLPEDKR